MSSAEETAKKAENNLTVSTKMSTDRLLCKTPRESPNGSLKEGGELKKQGGFCVLDGGCGLREKCAPPLCLGGLQVVCGVAMVGFGVMVILQEASLSQVGRNGFRGSHLQMCWLRQKSFVKKENTTLKCCNF